MNEQPIKQNIAQALAGFAKGSLAANALALFRILGYHSEKRIDLSPNTAENFAATFDSANRLNPKNALLEEWKSVDLLFQLTGDEISHTEPAQLSFESGKKIDDTIIESYLFFAVDLRNGSYTRTQLAGITREINKLFPMPVLVLFRHGQTLTLSIINRRLHKRDESKDVLEKVTLIKDIAFANPHRAHLEILFDLSLAQLFAKHGFTNFVELHNAWQKTLDSSELNKRFFREVANWYFWAVRNVKFPKGAGKNAEVRNDASVIRLITRLIFVWFVKEKGLVPEELFNQRKVEEILKFADPKQSAYYKAILQNLFFATLNTEMNTAEKPDNRKFRSRSKQASGRDQHHMIHNVYRYQEYFKKPDEALQLFAAIPFLNGGLFECLDTERGAKGAKENESNGKKTDIRIDGFSDRTDNELKVPDFLFFAEEQEVDLNDVYDTRNKRYKVLGLINIFDRYKFTVNENTPIEEEVALDPELLGKVFENLLAAYNPETGVTARKQTGSFYTPREIVNYMVDESLIAYFESKSGQNNGETQETNNRLRHLLAYNDEPHRFSPQEVTRLIEAIDTLKILDPACGSGAFPMGILHKLVFILAKLDPGNQRWKEKQIAKANEIPDSIVRERVVADIEQAFGKNELDYGRKLYLIENCIYGVDIQPIAVQIAKLRFFISLIVDQKMDETQENRGIRPLPNLETKFVAANTLLGIEKPAQLMLRNPEIDQKEKELAEVRRNHFIARTPKTKAKYRELDAKLRAEISNLLLQDGFPRETTHKLAYWDPYDQNASADFFDTEWMFGIRDGFDIVIGNPPYVRQEQIKEIKLWLQDQYTCYTGVADLYVYFFECGFRALRAGGVLTYISSNKYFRSGYGEKLRRFLSKEAAVRQLIDFGDAPVFTAISYPSIIILSKSPSNANQLRALTWQPGPPVEEFDSVFRANSFFIAQNELTADGWRLESPTVLRLLEKLRKGGKPLGEYVNNRFYYGIKTGLNEAFMVDQETRDKLIAEHPSSAEILKPFLRGRDVKRWRVDFANQYLIKIESSENKKHPWSGKSEKEAEKIFAKTYPAIHARFEDFRAPLINRDDQGKYFWELRSCVYWKEFEEPKIVIPAIEQDVEYAPDFSGYFSNDKTSICITNSISYLLGLLNSKLLWWFIKHTAASRQGGFYEFKPMYVMQIPIPSTANSRPSEILVDQILAAKRANPAADVSALEGEIDQLVYRLYGLTAEEIAIVEEAAKR